MKEILILPYEKRAGGKCVSGLLFARYARRAAAVLARADIRRATDIERQSREMNRVSRRTDRERTLSMSGGYARRAAAVLARTDIRRATDIERQSREMNRVSRRADRERTLSMSGGYARRAAAVLARADVERQSREMSVVQVGFL